MRKVDTKMKNNTEDFNNVDICIMMPEPEDILDTDRDEDVIDIKTLCNKVLNMSYTPKDGYASLAAAIVVIAVVDYISELYRSNGRRYITATMYGIEKFFKSEYFLSLSNIDPNMIMVKCKDFVESQKKIKMVKYYDDRL